MNKCSQIANLLRSKFPEQSVTAKAIVYTYLHHDDKAFEDRSIPAIEITVKAKHSTELRTGKRVKIDAEPWSIVAFLNDSGYVAYYDGRLLVMEAERESLPFNKAFPFPWQLATA